MPIINVKDRMNAILQSDQSNNTQTTNKGVTSQTSMQTTSSIPKPKFDEVVLPLMNSKKFNVDYDDYKVLKQAFEGGYENLKKDPNFKGNAQTMKFVQNMEGYSKQFYEELKKDKPDIKFLNAVIGQSISGRNYLTEAFKHSNNLAYTYNKENGKLMKRKDFDKQSNEWVEENDFSTSVKVSKDLDFMSAPGVALGKGLGLEEKFQNYTLNFKNENSTYKHFSDEDSRIKGTLRNEMGTLNKMWYGNALTSMEPSSTAKAETNALARDFTFDMIKYVIKHGTLNNDKQINTKNKQYAENLLKQLRSADPKEHAKIIQQNKSRLENLVDDMGFYGQEYLYKTHKDKFSKKRNLHDNRIPFEDVEKKMERINKNDETYQDLRGQSATFRNETVRRIVNGEINNEYTNQFTDKNVLKGMTALMVDERGNIRSWDHVKKELYKNGLVPTIYNSSYTGNLAQGALEKGYKQAYELTVQSYKKALTQVTTASVFKESSNRYGEGDEVVRIKSLNSVDLSMDNNGRLNNIESPKQQNLTRLWSVILNKDTQTFGESGSVYILPSNDKTELARVRTLEKGELSDYAKTSDKTMRDFLSSAKDLSDVKMRFIKHSNVPGYSIYQFIDKESNKSVSALINHKALGSRGANEQAFMNSWDTVAENNFKRQGYKQLRDVENNNEHKLMKDLKIKWDPQVGNFYLDGEYWGELPEGDYGYKKILNDQGGPIQSERGLTLIQATSYFEQLINRISKGL